MNSTRVFAAGCLGFGILAVPVAARAEPSSAVLFLIGERVSLMDWGMYRIEKTLARVDTDFGGIRGTFHVLFEYDRASNRIRIAGVVLPVKAFTPATARKVCGDQLAMTRGLLGIDSATGLPREEHFDVAYYFMPSSYQPKGIPQKFDDEIRQIVELHVIVDAPTEGGGQLPVVNCSGRLLSSEVLFAG